MNETTDLDQIAALEHRITSAFDRIARGVAARAAAPVAAPVVDTSELEDQLAALSAALEETQAALQSEQSANADLNDRLRALEAARQADADQAGRERAALQDQVQAAQAAIPEPAVEDGPSRADLEAELEGHREVESVLRRRISRLREERKASRADYNQVREQLEEVEGKLDQLQALVDASAPSASGELARLRESNRTLRDTIDELREALEGDGAPEQDLVTSALAAELESLKADRAAEASEARAILSELRPVLQGGSADA